MIAIYEYLIKQKLHFYVCSQFFLSYWKNLFSKFLKLVSLEILFLLLLANGKEFVYIKNYKRMLYE